MNASEFWSICTPWENDLILYSWLMYECNFYQPSHDNSNTNLMIFFVGWQKDRAVKGKLHRLFSWSCLNCNRKVTGTEFTKTIESLFVLICVIFFCYRRYMTQIQESPGESSWCTPSLFTVSCCKWTLITVVCCKQSPLAILTAQKMLLEIESEKKKRIPVNM